MVDSTFTASPLEAAAGAAGRHTSEAFALLGNDTRLAILLTLWEEHDPHSDDDPVPFSQIFERIECDDPGNLRYHLEKLKGQFVQHTKREGYELREPGLTLVQTVIAGAGVQDVTRKSAEIDEACPFCGASTAVHYREGLVFWTCSECEGSTPESTESVGFLSAVPFEPAGLADRTPEEIRAASWVASRLQVQAMFNGLCPVCSGPVEGWLDCCTDHDSAGVCENCGKQLACWARFQCRICKNSSVNSPKSLALFHPSVVAFYDAHEVSTRIMADDFESVRRVFSLVDDHQMEVVSDNPPNVAVTVSLDTGEVRLLFDETVSIVDVSR